MESGVCESESLKVGESEKKISGSPALRFSDSQHTGSIIVHTSIPKRASGFSITYVCLPRRFVTDCLYTSPDVWASGVGAGSHLRILGRNDHRWPIALVRLPGGANYKAPYLDFVGIYYYNLSRRSIDVCFRRKPGINLVTRSGIKEDYTDD